MKEYIKSYNLFWVPILGPVIKGFHIHHIKPKSTFTDPDDPLINHPSNLIALHPDDHAAIHKHRGDKIAAKLIIVCGSNIGELNHNSDGSASRKIWANATPERRTQQSNLLSKLNRIHKTKPKEDRVYTCSYCGELVMKTEFTHHNRKKHYFCDVACRNRFIALRRPSRKGIPNLLNRGRVAWNKGVPNPQAAINGKKGASKISKTVTGRKRVVRDGKTTWAYPTDPDYPLS